MEDKGEVQKPYKTGAGKPPKIFSLVSASKDDLVAAQRRYGLLTKSRESLNLQDGVIEELENTVFMEYLNKGKNGAISTQSDLSSSIRVDDGKLRVVIMKRVIRRLGREGIKVW